MFSFIHGNKTEHASRSWYEDNVRGEANNLDQNLLQELIIYTLPKKLKLKCKISLMKSVTMALMIMKIVL